MRENTTIWVVFVWYKEAWKVHHRYPSQLAAENAADMLNANGKLAFAGEL